MQRDEPQDNDNRTLAGGFAEVAFTGSAKVFKIQWKTKNDGNNDGIAGIQDARIEIWKLF